MRAVEIQPRKLVIFDIDDTLVHTQTTVQVIKDGRAVKALNSHDFTHYKLQPGESFDFENFRNAQEFFNNSKPIIPMIDQLKHDINTGNKVVMVTARADFDDKELFLDTFRKYGVDMDRVHVYRAGNMNNKIQTEEKKKIIIRGLLDKTPYTKAIMYDDAVPNLESFVELKDEYPRTKFYAWHVSLEGEVSEYHRTNESYTLEERKKKRKSRSAAYGPGLYGGYGYFSNYGNSDSGSDSGGGDGGGESMHEGMASKLVSKIFFARSDKTPKGWSYDHVGFITQDGKQIQMSGHKGNDVYITNAVTDDPTFSKQNIKVVLLPKPVSVPTTNTVGAENCGTFVANVLQANGVKGIDTQKIYSVFKKPPEQSLPENFVNEDAMMGKIADSGKIIRILKKAHTVPFSDEKNWLLVDMDPAKGNKGLGIKWIPADTRFEWVRPYRDTVDENTDNDAAKEYRAHLIKTLPQIMKLFANIGKGWIPSKEQMLSAVDTAYRVMKHTGNAKQAGKALMDELNTLYRKSQGKKGIDENFADGRNPQDKGDSKRHGVPTKASVSTLRKVAKQGGRKGQLSHWMANMKAGRNK